MPSIHTETDEGSASGASNDVTNSSAENSTSRKRTLYDFFSSERGAKVIGANGQQTRPTKKNKTQKATKNVAAVNTLGMASDVLIPVNYNDVGRSEPIRLVTRHGYHKDEGITFSSDELAFVGCLKKNPQAKKYDICTSDTTLVSDLKLRKVIIKKNPDVYQAVDANRFFKDDNLRTLAQAQAKFGKTGVLMLQGDHYINAADLPQKEADKKFAECCGNIYETRRAGLPEALYRLPDGNYGSADRLTRATSAKDKESGAMDANRQKSILILSQYDNSYYTPSTLRFMSEADPGYYKTKIASLNLPEDISDCPRHLMPLVLAKDPFENDLFHSSDNIMKLTEDDCRYRFDRESTLVQNRNKNGKLNGNFANFSKYERGDKVANNDQAQILRHMGFNNFVSDDLVHQPTAPPTSRSGKSDTSLSADPRSEIKQRISSNRERG